MPRHSLSLRAANILYLATILLIVVLGSLLQNASFGWGLLATEFFLILAPTLLFLRLGGVALRPALRLNRISPGVALAALLIGAGVWLIDAILSALLSAFTGYSVSVGPGGLPANAGEAATFVLALSIAAPLSEEVLFRGAILGAYRAQVPARWAIVISSLMFAFYHLQFQGLLSLLPVAFALGYVAWRANSLYASMLVHFANNALAAILTVTYALFPTLSLPFPSLPAAGIGALLLIAGILLLNRLAPRPLAEPAPAPAAGRPAWLGNYWPLAGAAVIYSVMAVMEVTTFARPELNASAGLALSEPAGWDQAASFRYTLYNKANQTVGSMDCTRLPDGPTLLLDCTTHVEPYQVTVNGGQWMSGGAQLSITARWSRPELKLVAMEGRMSFDSGGFYAWTLAPKGEGLSLAVSQDSGLQQEQLLPAGALLNYEFPLRLAAGSFQVAQAARVDLAWQYIFRPETKDSGPLAKPATLVVRGVGMVGAQRAWRVTADRYTLWYAIDEPGKLLKYDDGFETYVLN